MNEFEAFALMVISFVCGFLLRWYYEKLVIKTRHRRTEKKLVGKTSYETACNVVEELRNDGIPYAEIYRMAQTGKDSMEEMIDYIESVWEAHKPGPEKNK